jgi:hypothetical protein
MKLTFTIIALIALLVLVSMPANAQTIAMTNPDGVGNRDILIYYVDLNSTPALYGLYNTTSIITLNNTYDYIFTLKPQNVNLLDDPATFLSLMIAWLQTNVIAIFVLVFLTGLIARRI